MQIKFYETIDDSLLKFAVIISKYNGKWVYCKHKERNTYEVPGGHREEYETIMEAAKRELYEETGAIEYEITPVTVYSVVDEDNETFGMLYFADIKRFDMELHCEIEKIEFFGDMPKELTYPLIQPVLVGEYLRRIEYRNDRLRQIRESERKSHIEMYHNAELYKEGSWLNRPIKTVLELLPLFADYEKINVLDLGCGVGRNCIAIAKHYASKACQIDCVDILELAIEKLQLNAKAHGVSDNINGVVSAIEDFLIEENKYDMIIAVSALEHIDFKESFVAKLAEIRKGISENGIVCLIVNTNAREQDKNTGCSTQAQFEVNLETEDLIKILNSIFSRWQVIKLNVQEQQYDIPREGIITELRTSVVTFVARNII